MEAGPGDAVEACPLQQMEHGAALAGKESDGGPRRDRNAVDERLSGQVIASVMVTLSPRASVALSASGISCLSLCPRVSMKPVHDRNHKEVQREGPAVR